jgi:hypothetical protein
VHESTTHPAVRDQVLKSGGSSFITSVLTNAMNTSGTPETLTRTAGNPRQGFTFCGSLWGHGSCASCGVSTSCVTIAKVNDEVSL